MSDHVITRQADGRVLWILSALVIAAGFALMLGPGVLLMAAGFVWAGYLAYRRTPGVAYGLATLAIMAVALLTAWAIF